MNAESIAESRPFRALAAVALALSTGALAVDPQRQAEAETSRRLALDILGRGRAARWFLLVLGSVGGLLAVPLALARDAMGAMLGRMP